MLKFFRYLIKGKSRYQSDKQQFKFRLRRSPKQQTSPDTGLKDAITPARSQFKVASCQSAGIERVHNEDSLFTLNSFISSFESSLAFGLFLVADGMGGHQSGELASSLAVQGVSQCLMDRIHHEYLFERQSFSQETVKQYLLDAVDAAQKLILQRVPGGGTTLTLVLAIADALYSAHVGDSRLYTISPDGEMTLKTRDHSLVRRLVDLGEISQEEAEHHPHRNVLYRALGQTDPFVPELDIFTLAPGEQMMICTDGLWGVLSQEEMMHIIQSGAELEQVVLDLVQAANVAGGPDNISVILVERIGKFS